MSTHAAFRPQAGGVAAGSSRTSQGKAPATGSKSIPRTRPSHAGTDDDEADDDPIIASYPVYLNNSLTNPPSEQQGVPSRSLYILNHVTRIVAANGDSAPPTAPQRLPPATAVRIKPREGILEMDLLPYDTAAAGSGSAPGTISGGEYDRARGLAWGGTMLRRAAATGSGRSVGAGGGSAGLGLAGGFGVGMVAPGGGGGGGGGRRGPAASSATKVEMELEEDDDYDMSIVEDPMEVAAARMGPAEWERALAEHRALRIQTVAGQIPREPGYTKTMIGVFHKGR